MSASLAEEPGFHVRLVLDRTRASADGTPIRGVMIIANGTGYPIKISNPCNGWVNVGLVARHVEFRPVNGLVGCKSTELPVGTTRTSIAVGTTYTECSELDGIAAGTNSPPPCIGSGHDQIPPLPPGVYRTQAVFWGLSIKPAGPPSVIVTLTAPTH